MNEEIKKKEYQGLLVNEYRKSHLEETVNLTDDEVALMVPLKDEDIPFLIESDLLKIKTLIEEYETDIKHCTEKLNDPNTYHEELPELRADIRESSSKIVALKEKYTALKNFVNERNIDERGTSR